MSLRLNRKSAHARLHFYSFYLAISLSDTINMASNTDEPTPPSHIPQDSQEVVIIALMGLTGTGKTSFINKAAGASLKVGGTLEPCTYSGSYSWKTNRTSYKTNTYLFPNKINRHRCCSTSQALPKWTPPDINRHSWIR
jgi:hypothetical protein